MSDDGLFLAWTAGDWHYDIESEGHLFRWRARWINPDPTAGDADKIREVDFGLIPGGAFVALTNLVYSCDQVDEAMTPEQPKED